MGSEYNSVAEKLRYIREESGVTQRELAEALGITPKAVSAYEKERNAVSLEMLNRIIRFYKEKNIAISYEEFFDLHKKELRSENGPDTILVTEYITTPINDSEEALRYGKYNDIEEFKIVSNLKHNIFKGIDKETIIGGTINTYNHDRKQWEHYILNANTTKEFIKYIKSNDIYARRADTESIFTFTLSDILESIEYIKDIFALNDGLMYKYGKYRFKGHQENEITVPGDFPNRDAVPELYTFLSVYVFD